jgi:hypothetical protein
VGSSSLSRRDTSALPLAVISTWHPADHADRSADKIVNTEGREGGGLALLLVELRDRRVYPVDGGQLLQSLPLTPPDAGG